jgi:hypothetical protein
MEKSCATCGKQLQPDQSFCVHCGSAWTPAPEAASAAKPIGAALPPAVQQAATPAPTSGSGRSNGIALIVAIAVVALGLGGWLFLRHRGAAGSSVASSSSTSSSTTRTSSTSASPVSSAVQPAVEHAAGDTPAAVVPTSAETLAATEAAASSKPCSVVTRAEMEKILGSKIVKLTTTELTCNYFTDETTSAEVDTTWTGGKGAFAQTKGFNSAPGLAEPVSGIGDEAYLQAAGVLHVLKGDTYVVVNSRVYPNELETESAIARKVMEKLK